MYVYISVLYLCIYIYIYIYIYKHYLHPYSYGLKLETMIVLYRNFRDTIKIELRSLNFSWRNVFH